MEMNLDFWGKLISACIPAASGLFGVYLGVNATNQREKLKDERALLSDRAYLTTLLTVELERFADGCYEVASDRGVNEYGEPAGDDRQRHMVTTSEPKFEPAAVDGNWRSLSESVMDQVLLFPYRIEEAQRKIYAASIHSDGPEYFEYFNARRYWFAVVGLEAVALMDLVRLSAGMSPRDRATGEWARENRLQFIKSELAARVVD